MIKSSRLYAELKTFVWKNGKAQAQKGQNDDLIMALAIGVWLYDTSPQLSQHGTDLNSAMLAAFGVSGNLNDKKTQSPGFNNRGQKNELFNVNELNHNYDWLIK